MTSHYFRPSCLFWLILAAVWPLFILSPSLAAIGEDTEKPVPEFTRAGKTITAKLIPRAKSTSVLINFSTAQGQLTDVKGIEFETLRTPELDDKEFKSSFFDVTVNLPPGAEAEITISSAFFTIATEYWLYNSKKPAKWFNSGIKLNKGTVESYFVIRVTDGGEWDGDGMTDGQIQLIGGPKDYFWSYALGTLVVRFFGVFLVLSMLMIGMLSAGQIFITLEKKRSRPASSWTQTPKPLDAPRTVPLDRPDIPSEPDLPDPDTVAAIATALHLHLTPETSRDSVDAKRAAQNSWVQYGRVDIQNARFQTFLRPIHPKKHH